MEMINGNQPETMHVSLNVKKPLIVAAIRGFGFVINMIY